MADGQTLDHRAKVSDQQIKRLVSKETEGEFIKVKLPPQYDYKYDVSVRIEELLLRLVYIESEWVKSLMETWKCKNMNKLFEQEVFIDSMRIEDAELKFCLCS